MEHKQTRRSRTSLFDSFFDYMHRRHPSDRFFLWIVIIFLLGSVSYSFFAFSKAKTESVPTRGGTLVEGIIGTPRFVNPVLAITRADHDMSALIYSGLARVDDMGGIVPDIAESITLSNDGMVYNILIKENVFFHDGKQLTANDVAYTIALIQDPGLKSPQRGNWSGVSIEVLGEFEINIILEEAYVPFIENLTVGILPKHIWGSLTIEELPFSQHNTEPVGTGLYRISDTARNKSGLINGYTLEAFDGYRGIANISNIKMSFYQNEDALLQAVTKGEVMGTASLSYEHVSDIDADTYTVYTSTLPRVFAIFFNQNKSSMLREESVRKALSSAIDRDELIELVLHGYGVSAVSPIPPGYIKSTYTETESDVAASTDEINEKPLLPLEEARDILEGDGWKQNDDGKWTKEIDEEETILSIAISTANTPLFEETAEYLRMTWTKLGVEVSVALFEQSDLVQTVIRQRDYQALLFGTDIGRGLDLYPFWHSSQKDDPGLNVARYTNITADSLLEKARTEQDEAVRISHIVGLEKEIVSDLPAVFLFSPSFTYVMHNKVTTASLEHVSNASERFAGIASWHMNTNDIWPIFNDS